MGITESEINGLIAAVRSAAQAEIMPRFRRLSRDDIATKSDASDLVTVADHASEEAITKAAHSLMPDALVVGEEAVAADPDLLGRLSGAKRAVIVDPIDGTWNFASGIAAFGVILAVIAEGRTVFGLLYDPVLDDWIAAERGRGTWFHRPGAAPLRLEGPPERSKKEMHAFVPLGLYPDAAQAHIASQLPQYGRATSIRCSCHEYRTVAFGYADVVVSPAPMPWDHAAGVLAVEECGGAAWVPDAEGYDPATLPQHLAVMGRKGSSFDPKTDLR